MAKTIKTMIALIVVSLFAALAASMSTAANASTSSPQRLNRAQSYCPPNTPVGNKGQVPLYVRVDVHNQHGDLMQVGFPLRRLHGENSYSVPGWVYSGCWTILLYNSAREVPKKLCVTYYSPFWTPKGEECQTAKPYPPGGKQIVFRLFYSLNK